MIDKDNIEITKAIDRLPLYLAVKAKKMIEAIAADNKDQYRAYAQQFDFDVAGLQHDINRAKMFADLIVPDVTKWLTPPPAQQEQPASSDVKKSDTKKISHKAK